MSYGSTTYGSTTYGAPASVGLIGGPPTTPIPPDPVVIKGLENIEPPWPITVFGRRYFVLEDFQNNPEILLINNDETLTNVRGTEDPIPTEAFLSGFGQGRSPTEVLIIARKVRTGGIFLHRDVEYIVDEEEFDEELFPLIFERPSLGASNFRLERNPATILIEIEAAIPGRHFIHAHRGPFA